MKVKKKLKHFYKWHIKGWYHCDKCPYCWAEYSYEGDGDAGCYIYGDLRDTCRLLPPFKNIVGSIRKKSYEYWNGSQYDGIEEWYIKEQENKREFDRLLLEFLEKYAMCYCKKDGTPLTNIDGEICWVDKEAIVESGSFRIRFDYENFIAPERKPIRKEWGDLIRRTWEAFIRPIKPFLPRKKARKNNDL